MTTEVIYSPQYPEKCAIEDFKTRLEIFMNLMEKHGGWKSPNITLQSDFEPITPEFAIAAGHKEMLIKDIKTTGYLEPALLHCGGVLKAVDDIIAKKCDNAFATIPVGGHHAGPSGHWGFCYLNDSAIATHHLRSKYGMQNILYIDQDYHHGDGTEKFFRYDENFFYIDTHGRKAGERPQAKIDKRKGYMDLILPKGLGGAEYKSIMMDAIDYAVNKRGFKPDFIINYAGFDAHVKDGFNRGNLKLDYHTFNELTNVYKKIAETFCEGRLLCIGGGGYNDKEPDISAICTFNNVMVLAKEWDKIIPDSEELQESDSIARIKCNSILRDIARAGMYK